MKFNGTKQECEELARILDKQDGGAKKGRHVGGGRHVDMPELWDGRGPVPPGWTSRVAEVREDEDTQSFNVDVVIRPDNTLSVDEVSKLQAVIVKDELPIQLELPLTSSNDTNEPESLGQVQSLLSAPEGEPTKTSSSIITPARVATAMGLAAAAAELMHLAGWF